MKFNRHSCNTIIGFMSIIALGLVALQVVVLFEDRSETGETSADETSASVVERL